MTVCPRSAVCVFYASVESNIIKRVKYASAYMYCRGGNSEPCEIHTRLANDLPISRNLMPDGSTGDYLDRAEPDRAHRFLVIEDSPVFAALASNTIAFSFTGAEVVHMDSFEAAAVELRRTDYSAVVCGFGLDGDRTAHDVRRLTDAPMVVLTGRVGQVEPPDGSQVVAKGAGPQALASALRACLS